MKLLFGVLLLLFSADVLTQETLHRNPFMPVQAAQCPTAAIEEEQQVLSWALRGVIGRDDNWYGWIQTQTGGWIRIARQKPLPLFYWQLDRLLYGSAQFSDKSASRGTCRSRSIIELKLRK
ncbi:hypothetical protein EKN56_18815 [Limnobaculum zhutongyuii]|uniref:DUF2531 family protein n=1 Tax=Limnobaculum zhutongyuii TaxID=2498113 RepID=A0A411WQ52_9GAMM|nr:hypothetical protein [Limnobaculum zhutongyuii]QBH98260.1 hypothetical protein EKN56_18815 [Limnobaculum zhutongyuii]TQS89844.1 hypothetical protein ELQ32_05425 [Limnobaculum zhutongyuii]